MQFYDQYGKPIDRQPNSIAEWDFNYGQGFTNTALEKLGISPEQFASNPGIFGGTEGIKKGAPWEVLNPMNRAYELYGGSPTSNSGTLGNAMPEGLSAESIRQMGNDAPQAWRDLVAAQDKASQAKDPLPGFMQLSPDFFSGTPEFSKQWGRKFLRDYSGVKYDPEFGYIAPESAYGVTKDPSADPSAMPIKAMLAAFTGGLALTGGFGAAAGAGELGAASVGAGEAAGSSLYGLGSGGGSLGFNAGGFLGGAGATPGLGFVAPSAAGWGGFGASTLGTGLGSFAADYGLGSGTGNLGFDASGAFGGTSNLGGTAGSGLGINTPASSGWWGAGSGVAQAAPTGSLFDTLKNTYDQYGKPINQANSAVNKLTGGESGSGDNQILRTQNQPLPDAAGTTQYPTGGAGMGFGAGPPGSGYAGFPGFGTPAYGGLPQTPQYQPQGQPAQQDPNWFIPEYLRRGVIGR